MSSPAAGATADSVLEQSRLDELARSAAVSGEALRELLGLLDEPRWTVRRQVIATLAALGDIALRPLCDSLQRERGSENRIAATVDCLVASTSDVEGVLFGLTDHENPAVCADIAQILGRRRAPAAVPALIGFVGHPDDNVALAAIEALGRVGGRAAVDALVDVVERDYFFRTYPAIDVLGRSGDPRAVGPLCRLLAKPQYTLEAARALGRTAHRGAVGPLCGLLVSAADAHVRVAASALFELMARHRELYASRIVLRDSVLAQEAEAAALRVSRALSGADAAEQVALCAVLGGLQSEAASPALLRMLDGPDAVASAAAAALKQLGGGSEQLLRSALREGDSARRRVLLPLLPKSGGALEVALCLEDPDATVRALACDALARIGDRTVLPQLFACLQESHGRVVQAAIGAIQSLGSKETEARAIAAARMPSPAARRAALRILSYFGYANAIDVFSEALLDPDARVREVAITGLPYIEHPRARVLLLTAAEAASESARAAAMRGLGLCVLDAEISAALQRGLKDPDAWVRYYACQAIGKLRIHALAHDVADMLVDAAGQVRVAAIEALSHLKSDLALAAIRGAALSDEPDLQRAALIGLGMLQSPQGVPVLIAACAAPDVATRVVALSALSAFTTPETLQVVAAAMRDEDESVRAAAIGVLARWPGEQATRLLVDEIRQAPSHRALSQALETPAAGRIEGLLATLETADDELAPSLTAALGRLDSEPAGGAMLAVLQLPNPAARKAAAALLAAKGSRAGLEAVARHAIEDPSDEVRRVCALLVSQ